MNFHIKMVNVQVFDGFVCSGELKEKISFWAMLSSKERIHPAKRMSNSRPISSSDIWENVQNKHFRSDR